MNFGFANIRRGVLGAGLILVPIVVLIATEMTSAISWDFYPESTENLRNLTKEGFKWGVTYYSKDEVLSNDTQVLPNTGYGSIPPGTTRIVYEAVLDNSEGVFGKDLAIHTGRVFARSYSVFINGEQSYTNKQLGFDTNIPLPDAQTIDIKFDMAVAGMTEPGFDIRSQLLFGNRIKLDKITAYIAEKDHSVVLWLVIPRLIVGVLFAMGSLIFAYGIEYQLFGLYTLLSGLKTAAAYGEMGMYFPGVIEHGTLLNSLNIASIAVFLVFLNYFFRQRSAWPKRVAYCLAAISILNIIISRMWAIGPEMFVYVYYAANFIQQVICIYGALVAWQTYSFLKRTKRSVPRQVISLVLTVTFAAALPALSYALIASNIFWLGGPIFELCFILIVASCVSTDIGGVRAERDVIRRKLGMFVDEGKVSDIINTRGNTKEWRDDVSVMFVDIRSFCVMNEVFGAHAIFDAINDYYQEVINTVYQYNGIVDKFIGDGVLAVWGIDSRCKEPSKECLRAALSLRKRLRQLNEARLNQGKFQFSAGIGIHSGKVTYGLIGTDERAEFTIIGSTVNVAARIEKQTKAVRSDILISQDFYENLRHDLIVCPRGTTQIVDELSAQEIYQPIGLVEKNGVLLINDPVYEAMNLEPKASVLKNAPPNLLSYNYKEFVGKSSNAVKDDEKKATG